ncbi:PREDICTED: phytosulfokine receptor 1-like [Branchiostoma belcheri]|uniref:Phytosulfokine receptor 1-like n=1 Tax=Branchiostoma belcheri TaxID=7741 RepID=A0A6P4ZMF3_BRABE|nr:PREDICTED: phytosulfokine receptor 1-like [Branchiostoma belcheri]
MASGLPIQPQNVNGRLKLDLSNQGLTSIPEEVFDLTDLEILIVSNNRLTAIPEAIGRLQKLQWLDVEHNMVTTLPRSVCSLSNLEVLIVSYNSLYSLPPGAEFAKMKKLTQLYIHDNHLTEVPSGVCTLSNLEVLTVDELEQLQHLWYLSLSNNALRTLPSTLSGLHNVREVYLRNNKFETFPRVLCELPEMQKLDIRNNQITRLPTSLHRADKLYDLRVSGNPLSYPPRFVCEHGTSGILAFLRREAEKLDRHLDYTTDATGGQALDELQANFPVIHYDQLDFPAEAYLGHGGFASVEKAYHRDWKQNIAVKRLLPHQIQGSERELLYSEARKLNLGSRSDHVISLLGVCLKPHFAIVMPYMENGSLAELLLRDVDVPWALRWRMAHEISLGMTFLHCQNPQILHCDLKTENILLDSDFHVKISDFGQSKWKSQSRVLTGTSPKGGTITHAPPEFLDDINHVPTTKFDVYSFGVLLWEIVTRDEPYKHATKSELIRLAVTQGQRPDLSPVPSQLQDVNTVSKLMQRCWRQNPYDRPSFKVMQRCWRQNPYDRPSFKECEGELRAVSSNSSKEGVLQAIIQLQKEVQSSFL